MVEFLKSKLGGNSTSVGDFRGVLVSSVVGKRWHKHLRSSMIKGVEKFSMDTQCGGVLHRGTDFAAQYVRSVFEWAKSMGWSISSLFVDVVAAFYELVREFVMPSEISDAHLCAMFKALGFKSDEIHNMLKEIQTSNSMAIAGFSPHLALLVADAHASSWFSTEGIDKVCCSSRGSLPGDPLGDVVFNLLMARIIREIRTEITNCHLGWDVKMPSQKSLFTPKTAVGSLRGLVPVMDDSYVDDAAFMTIALHAKLWPSMIIKVVQICTAEFRRRALRVNFSAGKSEIIVQLRGPGSKKVLTEIAQKRQYY